MGDTAMSSSDQSTTRTTQSRAVRITAVFLAISYGVGDPVAAFFEFHQGLLSGRFHYPPAFIYLVCVVQFACAFGVLVRRLAPWAATVLTVTTLGAVASHFRSVAPRPVSAVIYTVIQVWFGIRSWQSRRAA
jgi:MFS-type transporter involved in bile tolerance (Atg22 family)